MEQLVIMYNQSGRNWKWKIQGGDLYHWNAYISVSRLDGNAIPKAERMFPDPVTTLDNCRDCSTWRLDGSQRWRPFTESRSDKSCNSVFRHDSIDVLTFFSMFSDLCNMAELGRIMSDRRLNVLSKMVVTTGSRHKIMSGGLWSSLVVLPDPKTWV